MLRNNGGLSLLRGRLGVQVVVDNHTRIVYSHLAGYETSDIRLLWTAVTQP